MEFIAKKRGYGIVALIALSIVALVAGWMNASAVHNDGLFELEVTNTGCPAPKQNATPFPTCGDANTFDDSGAGAPYDWETICKPTNLTTDRTMIRITPLPTGVDQSSCEDDWTLPDRTTFATGSKDIGDIAAGGFVGSGEWACATDNNVLEKDEITNAYAALMTDTAPTPDHDNLYFGLQRPSNNGTSFMGFWFLQADVDCLGPGPGDTGSNPWTGGLHTAGDLLMLSDFSGGGRISTLRVLQWNPNNVLSEPACTVPGAMVPDPVVGPLCQLATGSDCSIVPANDDVCGVVNNSTVTTPWWTEPRRPPCNQDGVNDDPNVVGPNPCTIPMDSNQLFEGGVDLTAVLGGDLPCFSTFVAETRSSDEETADLKDYVRGQFEVCGKATIIKQTDPPGASGTFTYTSTLPCGDFSLDDADSNPAPGETGVHQCSDLNPNTYYVTEDDPTALTPPFDLVNVVCTVDNNPDGNTSFRIGKFVNAVFDPGTTDNFDVGEDEDTVEITIGTLGEVTCTFTNRQRGSILIKKVDEDANPLGGACFSITPNPQDPAMVGDVCDNGTNDTDGRSGFLCVENVLLSNTYTVHESVVPPGYEGAADQQITVNTVDTCAQREAAGGALVLTFVDKLGSIFIRKVVDKAGDPLLGGACFTIEPDPGTGTGTFTLVVCDGDSNDADATAGEICVNDVPLDDYKITESTVPPNFIGDTPKFVTVDDSLDCGSGAVEVTFRNIPLSTFRIIFNDLTGFTDAAIDCSNATEVSENFTPDPAFDDTDETFGDGTTGLVPGLYNCTIDIDP